MKTAVEILKSARTLIEDERNWFGGGKNRTGFEQCCLYIAMVRAAGEINTHQWNKAGVAIRKACGVRDWNNVVRFNDSHTHAQCLDVFDRALKLVERK